MRTLFFATLFLVAGRCLAVPIDAVVPAVSPAGNGAQMTIVANGLGSMSDFVRFPGNNDAFPVAVGTDWVRVPVPGTWSGNIQAFRSSSGTWTDAYPIEITFSWSETSWASGNSTWKLNSNGVAGVSMTDLQWHSARSYDSWACASDFTHSYLGTTTTGSGSRSDGENVLNWKTSGMSSGTIAVCSWRFGTASGDIWEFDISFNAQHYQWAVNGDPTKMDVGNVATHELGHSIGFLDQYGAADFDETMYGVGANGETLRRTLHPYDVAGAESVYGHKSGRQNQTYGAPAGWFGPISPRNTPDATASLAPLPTSLNGGVQTYLNFGTSNVGGDCASPGGVHYFDVDGEPSYFMPWIGVWGAGSSLLWINRTLTVPGGLHTLSAIYDATEEHHESDETDNYYEAQFAYTPQGLLPQIPVVQSSPPQPGLGASPNTDGYSGTTGWWAVVGTMPLDAMDDYDTYVYDTDTGPTTGFRNVLESTFAAQGETDFIVVNGNVVGNGATFHAGIVEYDNNANGNAVVQTSQDLGGTLVPATAYGATSSAGGYVMGPQDIVRIHEVYFDDTATTYTLYLDNLSGGMDLAMEVFGPGSATYNQYEALTGANAGHEGMDERLDFQPATAGFHAVVVYKPDSSGYGSGGTYELRAGVALSNLDATDTPSGWFLPVTPRVVNNSTSTFAPGEPNLPGNTLATYINMAMNHEGTSATPSWEWQMWKDEESMLYWGSLPAGSLHQQYVNINNGPHNIRGGRHTLSARLDPSLSVPESNELDNIYDLQLVWSPLSAAKNVPLQRPVPPHQGFGALPNSDGFHFAPASSYCWVVASAPMNEKDDYDLIAYGDYVDAYTGFSSEMARSEYGGNGTDFVIGHFSMGLSDVYSAVVRSATDGGAGDYIHDRSDAVGNRATESGAFLNETFAPQQFVQIYEALLVAGQTYSVRLDLTNGTDQLAFEVFSGAGVASGRGDGLAQSVKYDDDTDIATFTAPTSTWYPIVVYRTNGTGIVQNLKYDLRWNLGAPVDASAGRSKSRFSFAGATPNPAPGRTMIHFTLAHPGAVQLDVYDLRGRLVRNLVDGVLSAGSHEIRWDGNDQRGRGAASGTYYMRLVSGDRQEARRVTVIR